ncbi:MAG TPA: ABC transporter ATP-binding protein [Rectinemataceae bacterium]|nr:ABC transporter ATP-binding protein [Rectinemataceae bacterium]
MGFLMDGLDSEAYDRKYSDRQLAARILSYFRPSRSRLIFVGLALAAAALSEFAAQVVISKALDAAGKSAGVVSHILLLALAIAGFGVLEWLLNYARQYLTGRTVGETILSLRSDAFSRALAHDLSFYDEQSSGKVVSRVTTDTEDFANVIGLVVDFLSQIILVVVFFSYLTTISLRLSLLLLAMAPAAAALALSFRGFARFVTQNAKRVTAQVNARIQESIAGISVAKGFRREAQLYAGFTGDNRLSYRFHLRRGITLVIIMPIVGIASGGGNGLLAWFGGSSVRDGVLSLGEWFLFMQAVGYFWWPLLNIASFWSQLQDGLAAAERVFALIDREPKVRQAVDQGDMEVAIQGSPELGSGTSGMTPRLDGRAAPIALRFDRVGFSYSSKEKVLDGFSLDIAPGEKLAIVGHTGAGKSSVIKLIARFYEFQEGRIEFGGRDIRSLPLEELRGAIGLVSQDPFLFPGTVLDNIRYARPEATDREVETAARSLGRGDWVDDLPRGLATSTGHRGSSISLGQRQLVSLARVLLKAPSIFILDEATSSVDPFTEAQIQEGLETLMADRTAIVIAHRLSTVRFADRIIVLGKGRILEEGSHAELLDRGGSYATLYDAYFRHQSVEWVEEASRS